MPLICRRPICLFSAAGARARGSGVAAHLDHNAGWWEARPFRAVVACGETWTAQGKALAGGCGRALRLSASVRLPQESLVEPTLTLEGRWASFANSR